MSNPQTRTELLSKLQSDVDGMLLTAAAYQAKAIKEELVQRPHANPAEREAALQRLLAAPAGDMTAAQAQRFAAQYEPVAALDAKGAGAVVFRDRTDQTLVVGIRGSDFANNLGADLSADRDLAMRQMPLNQITEIANFLARATTPKGQTVPQFGVRPVQVETKDLPPAVLANPAGALLGRAGQPNILEVVVSGQAKGEGTALGVCKISAGHSKGGPQSLVASGLMQCAHNTTYNAPHLPLKELQKIVDLVGHSMGQTPIDIGTLQHTALVGSGIKVVAGLNAPKGASLDQLPIPQSLNPFDNHGVNTGMLAAQTRLQIALNNPQLTSLEQVDQRLQSLWAERFNAPVQAITKNWSRAAQVQLQQLAAVNQWGAKELEAFVKGVANHAQPAEAHRAVPMPQLPERPHSLTPASHRLH